MKYKIPVGRHEMTRKDIRAVTQALKDPCLANGPRADLFAEKFAMMHGFDYGLAISNGTAALEIAYQVAPSRSGPIVSPEFTFCATHNAAHRTVGLAYTYDAKIDYFLDKSRVRITCEDRNFKNNVPVSIFGFHHGAKKSCVVDACESVGAFNIGLDVPDGILHVFSFFPNKQMTTCEGAVIAWNGTDHIAEKIKQLRSHGCEGATNARMSEIHAALGASQLKRLKRKIENRFHNYESYLYHLGAMKGEFFSVPMWRKDGLDSPFSFFLLFEDRILRDAVLGRLESQGIQTRVYFKVNRADQDDTQARKIYNRILHLPFSDMHTEREIEMVCRNVRLAIEESLVNG
jgi:perosamine synthetase